MAKPIQKDVQVEMQIKAIQLLKSSMNVPVYPNKPITNFNFNIRIENRVDASNKIVSVVVDVDIKNDAHPEIHGAVAVHLLYEIANFEAVIIHTSDGKFHIPPVLIQTLNSMSISSTRGVMYSTFKGTLLHGAVLPIIDPKQFQEGIPNAIN